MKNRMSPATPAAIEPQAYQTAMNEMTGTELQTVSGGINPQPLPPRVEFRYLITSAAFWSM